MTFNLSGGSSYILLLPEKRIPLEKFSIPENQSRKVSTQLEL